MNLSREELIETIYTSFKTGRLTMAGATIAADNIIEKEAKLAAQPPRAVDGAYWLCKSCGQRNEDTEHIRCFACGTPRN